MKRFLITTADERTWYKDQPVLFLGEWCRLYNRKAAWQSLDAEIVPYHWDDRKKLHRDYLYLKGLSEELLLELSERLNSLHGVDHTVRYWRILIGPWLSYFVQMMLDRWAMIRRAVNDYAIAGVRVLKMPPEKMVPNDMDHFIQLFLSDQWNEGIYGQLLQGFTKLPVEIVSIDMQQPAEARENKGKTPPASSLAGRLKRNLVRAASHVSRMLSRDDASFFLSSYLPIKQEFLLQCHLGQVPKIWRPVPPPKVEVDWSSRQWQMNSAGTEDFPAIVRAMIPRHMPTLYLEGYDKLQKLCTHLPWPRKPRMIFTSNSFDADDVFKAWAAAKVEGGAPLVVGQHGGTYCMSLWNFSEDHQCAISDAWLSWGWEDGTNAKITPVCNLKMFGRHLGWDPEGHALMVGTAMPRYSYFMYSVPVAGQWLNYFNDQCRFVEALPDGIRRRLLVRLHMQDFGCEQAARWKDRFPDVRLDDGRAPIVPLIKKSRLYISTYNATTFLESLAMNIPTIMFWNPSHWELRDDAIPYFERLKEVGIFHETPESAARQMSRVWDDVAAWWSSEPVQSVREEFCYRYSRMPKRPLEDLEFVLRRISKAAME